MPPIRMRPAPSSGTGRQAKEATPTLAARRSALGTGRHSADKAAPITKPDLGGGVSHPARFSAGMTDLFADLIDRYADPTARRPLRVLDPFAGTGRIHELAGEHLDTVGVEIEPEWAQLHRRTLVGSALELPFDDDAFDVICTSPCYGNRLADSHYASDLDRRRSYTHDLGRRLHPNNSGAMQWGARYRAFHDAAWTEAARVLKPDGLAVINLKDHVRCGTRRPVSAFHARWFLTHGFALVDCVPFVGRHLRAGANAAARVDAELVWAFIKQGEQP